MCVYPCRNRRRGNADRLYAVCRLHYGVRRQLYGAANLGRSPDVLAASGIALEKPAQPGRHPGNLQLRGKGI